MNKEKLRIKLLNALSDETRLRILTHLRHGNELCACDLDRFFDKSQSTLSRHLKKLEEADLIKGRKDGVKMFYKIKDPQIFKLLAVLDNLIKRNKKFKEIIEIQKNI